MYHHQAIPGISLQDRRPEDDQFLSFDEGTNEMLGHGQLAILRGGYLIFREVG